MNAVILLRALRDAKYTILGWGLGLIVWVALLAAVYPAIESSPEFSNIMEAYPTALRALVMSELVNIVTPTGFTWMEFGTWIPLFVGIQAIGDGLAALAGEERRGTLDLVLSTPVPRWRVAIEKFIAIAAEMAAIMALCFLGFAIATLAVEEYSLNLGNIVILLITIWLVLMVMTALTMAVSVLIRRKGTATAITVALVLGSYLLNTIGRLNQVLDKFRPLSFFYYYQGQEVILGKMELWGPAAHVIITLVLIYVTVAAFDRRDLAV